jgi:TolB-like protein/Tfp pilus assembly protein PilF/predicted Ser/Thr protein kinase
MIGQTLGHYLVVEKIGAGGMGEVYRAHDERLDRYVALKVLPAGLLGDEAARKRFRKEALALSKLSHPNIGVIHDFDTQDGIDFLVMEYIQGVTLREKLAGGALPEKEVATLGAQIAESLEEAHEQGVVHRDLKPENILVNAKGRAKVLDFGLAKLLRPASNAAITQSAGETRGVAGTLPYMAPEQLRGEPVEARSDIFSFGAVLYEMATGQRPFREELSSRLTDAILHQPPVPPRAINARLSPELERVILKSLEKEPENRYQSAKEIGVDLRRLGAISVTTPSGLVKVPRRRSRLTVGVTIALTLGVFFALYAGWRRRASGPTGTAPIQSLAVLPLENLSRDPAQDYFADGMTEELITDLAQIGALRVISRTSVMQFKGARKPLPEIGRELNVDAVVEGSVLQSGEKVRVTAQLIQAATDKHLWARSYQRDLRDILALQRDVAQDIAEEIRITLTPEEHARLASTHPVNPQAHDAYLKGRFYLKKRTKEEVGKAIEFMNQALELDPSYAPAYAGLADAYTLLGTIYSPPREVMPKAKAAAMKALQLDDELSEAHAALAGVKRLYDFDQPGAEREYQRAIALNSNNADAHAMYGFFLGCMGQPQESRAELKRAQELDPLSVRISAYQALPFMVGRQWDRAAEQLRNTLDIAPNYWWAHWWLGYVYEQEGEFPQAIAELQTAKRLEQAPPISAALGHVYAVSGKRDEAQRMIAELNDLSKQRFVCPSLFATIYIGLGEKARALDLLQRAYEEHSECLLILKFDARWDSVRSDSGFQDLLRRIGLSR